MVDSRNAPYGIDYGIPYTAITDTVLTVHVQEILQGSELQPRQARILGDRIARADGQIRSNDAICPQLHAIFLRLLFFRGNDTVSHFCTDTI